MYAGSVKTRDILSDVSMGAGLVNTVISSPTTALLAISYICCKDLAKKV